MRFVQKTRYGQDIDLFRHNGQRFWYALLAVALLLVPFAFDSFYIGEMSLVFIYAIAGVGLMLLVGYTGLVSLGHAAFLAIGAYAHAWCLTQGLPWPVSLAIATVLTAVVGALVAIPALRMTGIYLAVATLAFSKIVEHVLTHWGSVTGGYRGMAVPRAEVFSVSLMGAETFYYLCLAILAGSFVVALNVLRSPSGRAMIAVRDSEISAQAMGIDLARTKTLAFGLSAGFTGLAGGLFAHKIGYLAPDAFTLVTSIQLLLMVVVGGLGCDARRRLRRHLHRPPAAGRGLPARCDAPRDRADPGTGAGDLRPDPDPVPGLRAPRHLRPLGEGAPLFRRVPALPQGDLQAAAQLPAYGAGAVSLFEARDLTVSFGGIHAVRDLSFDVHEGEVFSIIGPNGAGKTTVFNLISRFYDLDAGSMSFAGEDITRLPVHRVAARGIARTFQNTELFEHETVLTNLLIGRHVHRGTNLLEELLFLPRVRRQDLAFREKVEDVIDLLDLQSYREQPIGGLPFGVRKMVEVARALCIEPRLLLLDEPSSGLNPEETEDLSFWIEDINQDLGITIVMVEHDMNLVSRMSHRVLAMADGEALAVGEPGEIQEHPAVLRAYLGD